MKGLKSAGQPDVGAPNQASSSSEVRVEWGEGPQVEKNWLLNESEWKCLPAFLHKEVSFLHKEASAHITEDFGPWAKVYLMVNRSTMKASGQERQIWRSNQPVWLVTRKTSKYQVSSVLASNFFQRLTCTGCTPSPVLEEQHSTMIPDN